LRSQRFSLIAVCGLAALALGCTSAEIERYEAPREERAPLFPDNPKVRLLGAIAVHGDSTWFFKLVGPVEDVAPQKTAFDKFIRSVRFTDQADPPITWTVPEGWTKEKPPASRYAQFRLGPKEKPLELSVTRLGREGEASSVLANVNRWRKNDLGLGRAIHEADLPHVSWDEAINGVAITVVDMGGPGAVKPATRPRPGGLGRPSFRYTAPDDWDPMPPNRQAGQQAAFRISDGKRTADMTVSIVGGTLEQNVNRWRDQVGLKELPDAEVRKSLQSIRVAGEPADYVDVAGPEGPNRRRILGVILTREGRTWFFKLSGPAELVEKEKARFEQFMGSVRFDDGRGDEHG
jgi:hypothetical protein